MPAAAHRRQELTVGGIAEIEQPVFAQREDLLRLAAGDWQTAADWANCVASFVVEKRGVAGVPKLAEVEKRWRSGTRVKVPVKAS